MTNKKRETFQNRFGFVLACIGSAVGMGYIWLFPYRVDLRVLQVRWRLDVR